MAQSLTTAERQIISAHIQSKAPQARCNLCNGQRFTLVDHLLVPITADTSVNLDIGGPPVYPFVGLTCDNCGHTHFISTFKISGLQIPAKVSPPPPASA